MSYTRYPLPTTPAADRIARLVRRAAAADAAARFHADADAARSRAAAEFSARRRMASDEQDVDAARREVLAQLEYELQVARSRADDAIEAARPAL